MRVGFNMLAVSKYDMVHVFQLGIERQQRSMASKQLVTKSTGHGLAKNNSLLADKEQIDGVRITHGMAIRPLGHLYQGMQSAHPHCWIIRFRRCTVTALVPVLNPIPPAAAKAPFYCLLGQGALTGCLWSSCFMSSHVVALSKASKCCNITGNTIPMVLYI